VSGLSAEEVVARFRAEGYLDDEIVDVMTTGRHMTFGVQDGHLVWMRAMPGSLQQQRVLREWLAASRGVARDDVTAEAVRAERARRIEAGEPSGYDALAEHFHCDASTIRRRLGVLAPR
jgi:hypothetical protein